MTREMLYHDKAGWSVLRTQEGEIKTFHICANKEPELKIVEKYMAFSPIVKGKCTTCEEDAPKEVTDYET